ncbi:recombinase [Acetobacter sp. CAG:267]|nr:recombinase [Acetobacter sp. CAG:267]
MQERDGNSLQNQLEMLTEYCQRKGLTIIKDAEIVESSTKGERKKFMEVIKFCQQQRGGVALVCLKTDRLFRNFKNYTMIDEMRKSGQLELHLIQENLILNKDSKAGDLTILGLNVVMAQNYALSLRDNVVYGMDYSVNQGRCMSKAPAGYLNIRTSDGKAAVIIDDERAPIIQKLFEQYATGLYSVKDMIKKCKEWGLISRFSGKPFDTSTIHRILNNRFYIGEMLYKNQWYKHNYETLIAPALFKTCQDIMHGRKPEEPKHFKTTEKPFIFRGLITCGQCGCMISSDRKIKPSGKEYVYLKCSHFKGNCKNPQVNEKVVLKQIEDELKNLSAPQEIMSYLRSDMEKIINRQNEIHNREVKAIRKKYDDCQEQIKYLRSLLLKKEITPEEYRDMNEDLKKEQYELEGKSELLTEADEKFSIAVATILSLGNNAYQIFQSSKVETKREILHILLSNLKLQDRKISYTLRKPYDYIRSLNKKIPSKTEGIAIGERNEKKIAQKSVININFFLSHREEMLAMKEKVQMIKGFLAA